MPHDAPKPPGYTRFVCVSDTHSRTDPIQMPYGDVLIHAGDFTELGLPSEVKKFNEWLGRCRPEGGLPTPPSPPPRAPHPAPPAPREASSGLQTTPPLPSAGPPGRLSQPRRSVRLWGLSTRETRR